MLHEQDVTLEVPSFERKSIHVLRVQALQVDQDGVEVGLK